MLFSNFINWRNNHHKLVSEHFYISPEKTQAHLQSLLIPIPMPILSPGIH